MRENRTYTLLAGARARLKDERKWGQGPRNQRGGREDISQAICEVAELHEFTPADVKKAYDVLSGVIGTTQIVAFNDAPGRTHKEILDLLDAGKSKAA